MRRQIVPTLAVLLVVTLAGCDWSTFGDGPGHLWSTSTEHAIDPSNVATLAQRWSAPDDAPIGAPVESNGVVYDNGSSGINAFDAATGTAKWTAPTNGFPSPPSVTGGIVYTGSSDGALYAFDASSGAQVWRQSAVDRVETPTVSNGRVYAATVHDGSVGGSPDEQLYAVDASTGDVLWHQSIGTVGASGDATAPTIAGNLVVIGSFDGMLRAFDAATGTPAWAVDLGGSVEPTTAYAGGRVYACVRNEGLFALDATNGHQLWQAPLTDVQDAAFVGSQAPAFADGTVFVGFFGFRSGPIFFSGTDAFDATTGALRWRVPFQPLRGVTVSNGVVFAAGHAFVALRASDGATVHHFAPSTDTYDGWAPISNNRVYVHGGGALHALALP